MATSLVMSNSIGNKTFGIETRGFTKEDRPLLLDMKYEIWADIIEFNGDYQISNYGNIRSFVYGTTNGSRRRLIPKKLIPSKSFKGYHILRLYSKQKNRFINLRIHREVCKYFVKNPNNFNTVNHIDGNKLNNYFKNLEWTTDSKNIIHAYKNGLLLPAMGVNRNKSNLKNDDVLIILKSAQSSKDLANTFNVSTTTINDIRSGRSWNHITGLPCTRKKKAKYATIYFNTNSQRTSRSVS